MIKPLRQLNLQDTRIQRKDSSSHSLAFCRRLGNDKQDLIENREHGEINQVMYRSDDKGYKIHVSESSANIRNYIKSSLLYYLLFSGLIAIFTVHVCIWFMKSIKNREAVLLSGVIDYDEDQVSCLPSIEWQAMSFPSCNRMHEIDLERSLLPKMMIGIGSIRQAWMLDNEVSNIFEAAVLKILLPSKKYDKQTLESHRVDALVSEYLTSSPYIIDIYGFCGNSVMVEYGEGTLEGYHMNHNTSNDLLRVVLEVVRGVKELHSVGLQDIAGNFQTLLVHNDIKPGQFVKVHNHYKLNDFNKVVFMSYDNTDRKVCPFFNRIKKNTSKSRSPEEYLAQSLNEKVDIYAIGNLIYFLLTKRRPFADQRSSVAHAEVAKGTRPMIPEKFQNSADRNIAILLDIMKKSHAQDPSKRPFIEDIENVLIREINEMK